jgi:glycosyltransferase involved in cell wall biosynthesis
MLTRAGYEPILIASEGWETPEDDIYATTETKFTYPFASHNPNDKVENIEELVDLAYQQLNDILPDDAVVLTHDLIFLPDYTILNLAARRLAVDRPSISWIHMVHSATSPQAVSSERGMYGEKYAEALMSPFPNSVIAYPNSYSKRQVAINFNFEEDLVVEIPHSTDPTEGLHPLVQRFYDDKKIGDSEVFMIYPLRLDRGKYAEADIELVAGFRRAGIKAQVLFCDFQSTGDDKVVYREDLKKLARKLDVEDRVTFLSEFDDMANMDVSHDIILDFFTLSNIFIMPSKSETYSLVAQEAMLKGNLVIMNQDFAPFRQIFGDAALYRQFDGANIGIDGLSGEINTTLNDSEAYYRNLAKELKYYLGNDKVLKAKTFVRTERNPDAVFRNYLEPLLLRRTDA